MDDSPLKRKKKALVSVSPRSGKGMVQGFRKVGDMAFLLGNPHILQNSKRPIFLFIRRSSGQ